MHEIKAIQFQTASFWGSFRQRKSKVSVGRNTLIKIDNHVYYKSKPDKIFQLIFNFFNKLKHLFDYSINKFISNFL